MTFSFSIGQHVMRASVLYAIRDYLGVGRVVKDTDLTKIKYIVTSTRDILDVIVPFFDKYNLQSSKLLDYEAWKKAMIIDSTVPEDIEVIRSLRSCQNNSRSPLSRARFIESKTFHFTPDWLLGFFEGEACFQYAINIRTSRNSTYLACNATFEIKQSFHDVLLLHAISVYFSTGYLSPKTVNLHYDETSKAVRSTFKLVVRNYHPIISFFSRSPLLTLKHQDFLDWATLIRLKEEGAHKTTSGLKTIQEIKQNINRGRKS